jgi:ATP-dependent Lon protease
MARGWESKSVEDQVETAAAAKQTRAPAHLTPQQREQQTLKQSLLMSRAQTLKRLESATNPNYRTQLERALKYLDEQLGQIERELEASRER